MILRVANLRLGLHELEAAPLRLAERAAAALGIAPDGIRSVVVTRRSLDARGRKTPHWMVTVDVSVDARPPGGRTPLREAPPPRPPWTPARRRKVEPPPIVVGAGPAGMFCALALVEAGLAPVVLERGRAVVQRKFDVARLYREGRLDPDSNVSFGEGGAGTFTDGKLSTRVRDLEVREVLHLLVELGGADGDILVTNKPHLGSERLPAIVMRLRERLVEAGCTFRFETRVAGVRIRDGKVTGVDLFGGGTVTGDRVILAPGNAGREIYEALAEVPGVMVAKPLAMGLRVEHPQALVDRIQYGPAAGHPALPPADYKLAATGAGRGVWAFCMCPGGVVVPTPTVPGALCINGMSGSRRASDYANSALVAEVGPADFLEAGFGEDVLAGMRFQEAVEAAAFAAGGGGFRAPAQRLTDFVRRAGPSSGSIPSQGGGPSRSGIPSGDGGSPDGTEGRLPARTSYPRGLVPADLSSLYPGGIIQALREAVHRFGRTLPGFLTEEAVLIGVETRTSAPVSFPRNAAGESLALPGLYPCGEGCGHAGGIVSAAIDGLRIGRRVAAQILGAD